MNQQQRSEVMIPAIEQYTGYTSVRRPPTLLSTVRRLQVSACAKRKSAAFVVFCLHRALFARQNTKDAVFFQPVL